MRKLVFLTCLLIITGKYSYSQEFDSLGIRNTIPRMHLIPLGLSLEQRIFENITILGDLGVGLSLDKPFNVYSNYISIDFQPYISLSPRAYLFCKSRYNRGKVVNDYSGPYWAIKILYNIETPRTQSSYILGSLVGFQRTFKNDFYFNLALGYGALYLDMYENSGIIGEMSLGYCIYKKHN